MQGIRRAMLAVAALGAFITPFLRYGYSVSSTRIEVERRLAFNSGLAESILADTPTQKPASEDFVGRCDQSVGQTTLLITDLRGGYQNLADDLRASIVLFLTAQNEAVRGKNKVWINVYPCVQDGPELRSDDRATRNDAKIRSRESSVSNRRLPNLGLLRYATRPAIELGRDSAEFWAAYEQAILAEANLTQVAKRRNFRFVPIFKKYEDGNRDIVTRARKFAGP